MPDKFKKLSDLTTGREIAQWARQQEGVLVHKVGSYQEISNCKGEAHVPDSDRALPKPSRQLIWDALKLIGLAAVLFAVLNSIGVI